jgi:hypothetical protein
MAPFVSGRCLGVLFRDGYGLIILQAISWLLPREMIFYVIFLQVLSLLYIIPRRLARSIFFDMSQLLIWNRLGILKKYVKKIDHIAIVAGVVTAGLCLLAGLLINRFPWWLPPERVEQVRPLIYAMVLFLFFNPQNEMWQSIRDAAGELRFNNILLFITHYLIALPLNLWMLVRIQGQLRVVESHGLDFVVVSHALLFVRVLLVDGAIEGVRAFLSRIHGLRFRWAENSPMRVTRSLMDSELEFAQSHSMALGFSQDLANLWGDRFLRARDEGLVSLPYWGTTVNRFFKNEALFARGMGFIRLSINRQSQTVWKPGGVGITVLRDQLRPIDNICRVSPTRMAIFLPSITEEELRRRVCEISASIGIHLFDLTFVHSTESTLKGIAAVTRWMIAPVGWRTQAHRAAVGILPCPDYEWHAVSELFSLSQGSNEEYQQLLRQLCTSWGEAEKKWVPLEMLASQDWMIFLQKFIGAEVQWFRLDQWAANDLEMAENIRLIHRVVHTMDIHRIPNFRRFLKADASHLLPIFSRTNLVGVFVYPALEHVQQLNLVRVAAAFYLWSTLCSIRTFRWAGADGLTILPVFQAELDAAKLLWRETGIPYARLIFPRPRFEQRQALLSDLFKEAFGHDALITGHRRSLEILLPGMDPYDARVRFRNVAAGRPGVTLRFRAKGASGKE